MRYLKMTFVRVAISFFGASLANELINANLNSPGKEMPVIFFIILATSTYYGLTLYTNNHR